MTNTQCFVNLSSEMQKIIHLEIVVGRISNKLACRKSDFDHGLIPLHDTMHIFLGNKYNRSTIMKWQCFTVSYFR